MMKAVEGIPRLAFVSFFASHIIFTVLLDGQILFPATCFPEWSRDLLAWYAAQMNDPVITPPPSSWFVALVMCEFLFQLPYFFVALHYLWNTPPGQVYPAWFQTVSILYGTHTATGLVPILATLAFNPQATQAERMTIVALYLPYLLFPLWILSIALQGVNSHSSKVTTSKQQ